MPDGIAWQLNQVPYTPGDDRTLDAIGWASGGALLARAGVRPGAGLEVSVGGTPEALILAPGGGIITDPAGGGSYRFAIPSTQTRQLPARPATGNSRIVDLVARILNADERPADATREVRIELLSGVEAASPPAPTLPAGYLRLRRAVVPSTGAVALSVPPPRTTAIGGVLPVASQAERDAIVAPYDGLIVHRDDTDTYEARSGGIWRPLRYADEENLTEQHGVATVNIGSDGLSTQTVTFDEPFPVPATVVVANVQRIGAQWINVIVRTDQITATNFRLTTSNGAPGQSGPVGWVAYP